MDASKFLDVSSMTPFPVANDTQQHVARMRNNKKSDCILVVLYSPFGVNLNEKDSLTL
jgi:hypothetical protein